LLTTKTGFDVLSDCVIENDILVERAMRSNRKSEDVRKLARMDNLYAIVVDFQNFQCAPSKIFNSLERITEATLSPSFKKFSEHSNSNGTSKIY